MTDPGNLEQPADGPGTAKLPPQPSEAASTVPQGSLRSQKLESRKVAASGVVDHARWTDIVQAASAVALVALAVFGYFYSVYPHYALDSLTEQKAQLDKELAGYTKNLRHFVIVQFLGKVQSAAQSYKCSPTVWDLSFPDSGHLREHPPTPQTGETLIDANLKNLEFALLRDDDRNSLINTIVDFVKRRDSSGGFVSPLEIQHAAHLTGTLAIMELQNRRDLHRFSQTELQHSEEVFRTFDQSMTALQAYLLPDEKTPINSAKCIDLGLPSK